MRWPLRECFGTIEGLIGKSPQTCLCCPVCPPHILYEEAEVQRRGRSQMVHFDYTPSQIPSPVLLPHLTPSSIQLAKCGVGKARTRRSYRMGTGIQLSDSLIVWNHRKAGVPWHHTSLGIS